MPPFPFASGVRTSYIEKGSKIQFGDVYYDQSAEFLERGKGGRRERGH